jgi:two-component sensor histidine kinase/PAS domain-containing protein
VRIQTKLILSIVPIVLVGFFALAFLSFNAAKDMMRSNAFHYVDSVLESRFNQTFFRRSELLRSSKMDKVASFLARYQQEALSELLLGSDSIVGCFLIFDATGKLLSAYNDCTGEPLLSQLRRSALDVAADPAHQNRGQFTTGGQRVYGARYFAPWDWTVVYATELSGFEKAIGQILQATLLLSAACIVLCTLVMVIVFRKVFGLPVTRLKTAAARIANREPNVAIAVDSKDELGELSSSLNAMASGISAHIRELECLKAELEQSNQAMTLEIAQRCQAQADLKIALDKRAATLDALPDLLFEVDQDGRIHDYHTQNHRQLYVPPAVFLGKSFTEVLPSEAAQVCMHSLREASIHGRSSGGIYGLPLPQGESWFELSCAAVPESGNPNRRFVVLARDITERMQTQQALQTSLKEKTALLLEVHHRVKNNLQVITSLLRLEGFRTSNAPTKAVLQDMQGRVRAMALLHETIYRKGNFAAIDLGNYVGQIAVGCLKSLLMTPGSVQLRLEVEALQVGLDQASPCGMLMSELVSNCLKHGFPEGRTGEIFITLKPLETFEALEKSSRWRLRVSDTGVGLPADFETRRQHSLGLQLASDLAMQMGGTLHIGTEVQAVFTVDFTALVPEPFAIHLADATA